MSRMVSRGRIAPVAAVLLGLVVLGLVVLGMLALTTFASGPRVT